mmetsp:Transcript_5724/g.12465  ORF Transcript_5724/g.12465 Transcript_5724/m.12465 type:complete len:511 (-) Transcript_5724:162-1694(-)
MSPSIPSNSSVPSLSDMTFTSNEKGNGTPMTSGTTSPVTSDSSVHEHIPDVVSNFNLINAAAANIVADDNGSWYYYLTPNAAKNLPHYQYHGADLSLLYKYLLSPLAAWCVDNLTPAWLAPNVITLIGLAWMLVSYCIIWYWCPGMYEANTDLDLASTYAVPGAIFLFNGCAMLIYQTLDNMDGKQARKTGSSSPLGLLFDHGCDAVNTVLGSANWIAAMGMVPGNVSDLLGNDDHGNIQSKSLLSEIFGGDAILAALLVLGPMILFYIGTWEQYYTGKLILPQFNGASDGIFLGATLHFVSFLWGPMFWQSTTLADGAIDRLGFATLQGRVRNMDVVLFAAIITLVQEAVLKTSFVVRNYGLQTLRTAIPHVLLVASVLAIVHLDPTILLRSPRTMMHLMSGLFTEQTTQLMLDHMVEEKFELRNRWCLVPTVFVAAMMTLGVSFKAENLDAFLFVYTVGLWIYLAFKISVVLYEVCDVLGIWCFDIVTPHPKKLAEVEGDTVGTKKSN